MAITTLTLITLAVVLSITATETRATTTSTSARAIDEHLYRHNNNSKNRNNRIKDDPLNSYYYYNYNAYDHVKNNCDEELLWYDSYDIVIYRATPGGIAAALAACETIQIQIRQEQNKHDQNEHPPRVLLMEPTWHVGGMATSGGIGLKDRFTEPTQTQNTQYQWALRNANYYGMNKEKNNTPFLVWHPDPWVGEASFLDMLSLLQQQQQQQQQQEETTSILHVALGTDFVEGPDGVILHDNVNENDIGPRRIQGLILESNSCTIPMTTNTTTTRTTTTTRRTIFARTFIDASYEGELMQAVGKRHNNNPNTINNNNNNNNNNIATNKSVVDYTWGRESATQYNEPWGGVSNHSAASFDRALNYQLYIDPFVRQRQSNTTTNNNDNDDNDMDMVKDGATKKTSRRSLRQTNNKNNKKRARVLLPYVQQQIFSPSMDSRIGQADDNLMAYSYRVCLTQDPDNFVAVPTPPHYNPQDFELARRLVQAQVKLQQEQEQQSKHNNSTSTSTSASDITITISEPHLFMEYREYRAILHHNNQSMIRMKYDACCGNSPVGLDATGMAVRRNKHNNNHNHNDVKSSPNTTTTTNYATASRAQRQLMAAQIAYYVHGLLWFWRTDPAVPIELRQKHNSYGLCKDHWPGTTEQQSQLQSQPPAHFPPQLYVREAVRMVGDRVFIQQDRQPNLYRSDSIGIGHWGLDIHDMQRVAVSGCTNTNMNTSTSNKQKKNDKCWKVVNEGLRAATKEDQDGVFPFELPYWLILPKKHQMANLAVVNCPSASHVAFGALRVEPTLWQLGAAAGTAAALMILDDDSSKSSETNPHHDQQQSHQQSTNLSSFHSVNITLLQKHLRLQGVDLHLNETLQY